MSNLRTIYLIRHAKTESSTLELEDFDRALTDRGKNDAAMVSEKLLARGVKLDLILSSPASRAKMTAEIFASLLKPEQGIQYIAELYLPEPFIFDDVISKLDRSIKSVAIVSHNYGITDYANSLGIVNIDHMPTSSVLGYEEGDKRRFLFFEKK